MEIWLNEVCDRRRSLVGELRKRAEEYCGKGVLEKACLLELG